MICDTCNKESHRLRSIGDFKFACKHCLSSGEANVLISKIVTFYDGEGKPIKVSQARIDMIKSRYLSPEDGNTVLMRDKFGKKTDRKAFNY